MAHPKPLPLTPQLEQQLLLSLNRSNPTVITHIADDGGDAEGWRCLLLNWATSIGLRGLPGARVVAVCLDAIVLSGCNAMTLTPPLGVARVDCLDGTDYGMVVHEMVRNVSHSYARHREPRRTALVQRDRYIALTWVKPTIVYTATSHGFGIIYSDCDIVFRSRLRVPSGALGMMRDQSGYIVAPPYSSIVRAWYESGVSMRWTGSVVSGPNCCDQVALAQTVREAEANRLVRRADEVAEPIQIFRTDFIPQCAEQGGHLSIGTHYNCIGDVANVTRTRLKAAAMRRNGQWHVANDSKCAALERAGRALILRARA